MSERTIERTPEDAAAILADLIDLLQLEFDALPAYSVAIAGLRRPDLRGTLEAHRADHERHVRDLSAHIGRLGGVPLALPHLPTGLLKLGVQMAGLAGDDRAAVLGGTAGFRRVTPRAGSDPRSARAPPRCARARPPSP